jgi:prepilin-type N-terminal cleavage/methylation domain-containing protein
MKREKGFTLVETLAVIIILGILLIITIPAVSKYIVDSKKGSYAASAQAYIETARANYGEGQYGEYIKENQVMLIPIQFIELEKSDGGESPFDLYNYDSSYVIIAPDKKGFEVYISIVDNAGNGIEFKKMEELDRSSVQDNLTDRINSWKHIVDGSKKFKMDTTIYSFYEKRNINPGDAEKVEVVNGDYGFVLILKASGTAGPDGGNDTPGPGQVMYTITYDANGGKGTMSTQNKVSGIDSTIYSNGFESPDKMYFVNWNTKANGSGVSYEENSTYNKDQSLVLYAQWALTQSGDTNNIITFNANGGSGSMPSLNKIKDASISISDNGFEPPYGKTFIRWNTKADGTGESFIAGQLYSTNKDVTLYAQWTNQVCSTGQYVNGSRCSNCPVAYPFSPDGANAITDCYLITAATKYVATQGDGQVTCQGNNYCTGGVTVNYGETGGMEECPETADGLYESSAGSAECSRYEAVCSRYALVFEVVCNDGTEKSGYYGSFSEAEYNVEISNSACTKICSQNGSKCKSANFSKGVCYEHVVTTYYYPARTPTTTTSKSGNPPQGIVYN